MVGTIREAAGRLHIDCSFADLFADVLADVLADFLANPLNVE